MEQFKSTKQLASIVKIFLVVGIITDIANIISGVVEFTIFPDWVLKEDDLTDPEFMFTLVVSAVALTGIVCFLGTVISFLMWIYRSYNNLKAFEVSSLRSSPVGAVVGWFIPFLNLIVPLKIVNEIYHSSDPSKFENEVVLSDNSTTLWHGIWWALWLVGNFLGSVTVRIFMNAETQATMDYGTKIDMISSVIWMVAAFMLFEIVSGITENQDAIGQRLRIQKPPKPPVFS